MKKIVFLMMFISCCIGMNAQKSKEEYKQAIKERKEMLKFSKEAMQKKITKEAKESAKHLKKEGWKELPGERPLDFQLDEQMRLATLMEGNFPKYLMGTGNGVSRNMQMAYKAAQFNSKSDIAGQFETEIDEVIDQSMNENQHNEEFESMFKIVSEATQYVSKNLKNIKPAVKMCREKGGEYEVMVIMYTDFNQAKTLLLENMEKDNSQLRERMKQVVDNK